MLSYISDQFWIRSAGPVSLFPDRISGQSRQLDRSNQLNSDMYSFSVVRCSLYPLSSTRRRFNASICSSWGLVWLHEYKMLPKIYQVLNLQKIAKLSNVGSKSNSDIVSPVLLQEFQHHSAATKLSY